MTTHNIGDFEKAVVHCEELKRALLESIRLLGSITLVELEEHLRLKYHSKYPIRMSVSVIEKKMIHFRRGNLKKEDKR